VSHAHPFGGGVADDLIAGGLEPAGAESVVAAEVLKTVR
jgi:hypothetical protein